MSDYRVLSGEKVIHMNRKYKKKKKDLTEQYGPLDVFANFRYYDLPKPEVLRLDSLETRFRFNQDNGMYDSIICDPPYGIRAAMKTTGKNNEKLDKRGNKRKLSMEKRGLENMYDKDHDFDSGAN